MPLPTPSVAILLFACPAAQEAVSRPLSAARRRNERLWQTLESMTWHKIQATQLPAFLSHQLLAQPTERPFGEQVRWAAQAVLDQGYDSVLCVGNDCPGLRGADIQAAAQLARLTSPDQPGRGTLPMGIDQRGGVYIMGLNRTVLQQADAFDALPWRTTGLASALAQYMQEQGQWVAQLPAIHRVWNATADICLEEAIGEPGWLLALADLLKHVAGVKPGSQSIFRTSALPTTVGLRLPPQP